MYTNRLKCNKPIYRTTLIALVASLLGGCSQSHQLGMNPQGFLKMKLSKPDAMLTSDQDIALVDHCAKLGEQNAEKAESKATCLALGSTGVGESTSVNCFVGCKMKFVGMQKKVEIDEFDEEIIVVDSESNLTEVLPIGHHGQSQTFLPMVVQDLNSTYCDCPGFEVEVSKPWKKCVNRCLET